MARLLRHAPVKEPGTIRIILADSQAIYRVGIRKIFALEDDIRVVAQADSLENLRLALERQPADVVLIEGGLLTGVPSAIPDVLRIAPDVKLIVQAMSNDESQTVDLYRRGVRGIISRSISPDLLVRCVRRIATGETWIDNQAVNWVIDAYRAQAAALVSPRTQPRLSPKETAIITCITQGKRNKEIAFPTRDYRAGHQELSAQKFMTSSASPIGSSLLSIACNNKIIKSDADEIVVAQKIVARRYHAILQFPRAPLNAAPLVLQIEIARCHSE